MDESNKNVEDQTTINMPQSNGGQTVTPQQEVITGPQQTIQEAYLDVDSLPDKKIKNPGVFSRYMLPALSVITAGYWLYNIGRYYTATTLTSFGSSVNSFYGGTLNVQLVSLALLSILLVYLAYTVYYLNFSALAFLTGLYVTYMIPSRLAGFWSAINQAGIAELLSEPTFVVPVLFGLTLTYAWTADRKNYL